MLHLEIKAKIFILNLTKINQIKFRFKSVFRLENDEENTTEITNTSTLSSNIVDSLTQASTFSQEEISADTLPDTIL